MISKKELENKKIRSRNLDGKVYYLCRDIKEKLTEYRLNNFVRIDGESYALREDIVELTPFDRAIGKIMSKNRLNKK